MDLEMMKCRVRNKVSLTHEHAASLIEEVERLTKKCEERGNMLEDVVNELDLSDGMIEQYGPMGTAPATLVRLVMEQKDLKLRMMQSGMVPVGVAEVVRP
jgi:hypothetical protein